MNDAYGLTHCGEGKRKEGEGIAAINMQFVTWCFRDGYTLELAKGSNLHPSPNCGELAKS